MNSPSRRQVIRQAALVTGLLTAWPAALGRAETREGPSKQALAPESMAGLHKLIRLQPGEYRWDEVPWYASIWHARKAAAAQDKPILVFGTGGAGFNDPLGNC